ncbi:tRNA (cytidine(34)-2'-O)-methyltransferase [Candidatus Similichlamydia laticola]|uniref:Putative tRNA (cytidine(34)-2'-O)-methyltransferase n=1 Tax=Candidatus Similichlamydia laticola TaxID=2170265 RepID=A0A369KEN1_9BACT|nr:tRNA (cytidine(34)-2'-O)-methyltransferase [Candidatus Similichlamydia laticola]RDB31357.1 tRNA (cytidine(34)-2'-O)-methyltransferase [Candidatus Similichlamydia laticola]
MKVVLYRPEIPQNTGNIARTCAATGCSLLLIPPLGFFLDAKTVRRSSVQYMPTKDIQIWDKGEEAWLEQMGASCWMFSTKGQLRYDQVRYEEDPILLFGRESSGLPKQWLERHPERSVRIPVKNECHSLNLSNAVSIALYEVLRQKEFAI